ncbi:tRNA CCA-pyrophosphorylase [Pusillimonas sp. TS35]|nr:tRNA CCA-pyrophosphorylase [Pusillimonas sp. TS35]
MEVYIVGGAVRDALLGLPAGDSDWVVVGATPEDMSRRGFIPVGGDFPVFLHPRTKEEYALARTERKSGRGYKGFTFYTGTDVTLEDDLRRRDLTINAIARRPDGTLVDPLGGLADLRVRVLRHVGHAFVEDPVRLLRLARFAARFHDFSVAPETMALARRLVADGEVDALVPERVWKEVAKGLMTSHPARMFDVLEDAGALARVLPGLAYDRKVAGAALACAAQAGLGLAARFALLCRTSPSPQDIGRHVKAPSECIDYARLLPDVVTALRGTAHDAATPAQASVRGNTRGHEPAQTLPPAMGAASESASRSRIASGYDLAHTPVMGVSSEPAAWLALMERCDALRKPERFLDLLAAAACVVTVDIDAWRARLQAVRGIDAGAIARSVGGDPARIKPALHAARLESLTQTAAG